MAELHVTGLVRPTLTGFVISCLCGWSETSVVRTPLVSAAEAHRDQARALERNARDRARRAGGSAMTYDPLFVLCLLTVVGGYVAVFWLLNHEWTPTVRPERTDPGREAVAALTAPRPFPTGQRRLPSPDSEFEARRAARTTTTTTTGSPS